MRRFPHRSLPIALAAVTALGAGALVFSAIANASGRNANAATPKATVTKARALTLTNQPNFGYPHLKVSGHPLKSVTFVNPLPSYPEWAVTNQCFARAARDLGATARLVGPTTINIPQMVTDLQQAIALHTQAIITAPIEPGAFTAVLSSARKHGILVATVNADSPQTTRNFNMETSTRQMGALVADTLIKRTRGHAEIGIISTGPTEVNQSQEIAAFKAKLRGHPGMKVVSSQYDNSESSQAASETSAMLAANPALSVVWTVEGEAPPGVITALRQAHKVGKVLVIGVDLTPQTRADLRSGAIWGTTVQNFCAWGGAALYDLAGIKEGGHVPSFINTGSALVTKSNLNDYRFSFSS